MGSWISHKTINVIDHPCKIQYVSTAEEERELFDRLFEAGVYIIPGLTLRASEAGWFRVTITTHLEYWKLGTYWGWQHQAMSNTDSTCISVLRVNASQATITDISLHAFRPCLPRSSLLSRNRKCCDRIDKYVGRWSWPFEYIIQLDPFRGDLWVHLTIQIPSTVKPIV